MYSAQIAIIYWGSPVTVPWVLEVRPTKTSALYNADALGGKDVAEIEHG